MCDRVNTRMKILALYEMTRLICWADRSRFFTYSCPRSAGEILSGMGINEDKEDF